MTAEDRAAEFCHRAGYTVPGDTYGKLCRILHAAIREAIAEEREACVAVLRSEKWDAEARLDWTQAKVGREHPLYNQYEAVIAAVDRVLDAIRARGDAT